MTGPEKRKHKRATANFMVTYRIRTPMETRMKYGDKDLDGVANDLSQGGLCLMTDYKLPAGAVLDMKFRLMGLRSSFDDGSIRKVEVQGESRYCFMTPEKSFRIGVRFLNLSETDRTFIGMWI